MNRIEKQKFTLAKAPNIDPLGGDGYFVAHFMVIDRTLPTGTPEYLHCDMKLTDEIRTQCDVLKLLTGKEVELSGNLVVKNDAKVLEVTAITMKDMHQELAAFLAESNTARVKAQDLDSPSL